MMKQAVFSLAKRQAIQRNNNTFKQLPLVGATRMFASTIDSPIRFNYAKECEDGVNSQINYELHASYTYLALASYFDQATVSLPGTALYFKNQANEERDHAHNFVSYQNHRGGEVVFEAIAKPEKMTDLKMSCVDGFMRALELERNVYGKLLELYKTAEANGDYHLTGFLQTFVDDQQASLRDLQGMITKARSMGDYMFDNMLLSQGASNSTEQK